ncbi:hypothetical protein K435DRAFT_841411 [Dendrothele bispora CBS 962.96]|uniref:Uncharacterized protein n=1 Tax=Dendrothele bispora (strain CBS 962.96) TaxID=1314807 RepID=A0A4S8LP63_DENBC|nr:hypothetical protein K435DRAFT_841411 [Dendrothele bispora CBS 962.96]
MIFSLSNVFTTKSSPKSSNHSHFFQTSHLATTLTHLGSFFMSSTESSSSFSDAETSDCSEDSSPVTSMDYVHDTRSVACTNNPQAAECQNLLQERPLSEVPKSILVTDDTRLRHYTSRPILDPPPSLTPRSSLDCNESFKNTQIDDRKNIQNVDSTSTEYGVQALSPPPWHYKSRRKGIRAEVVPEHITTPPTTNTQRPMPFEP